MIASEKGFATAVKCLTECGFPTSETDADGWSALHISASRGDLSSIKYHIIAGADRNMNTVVATPLHVAVEAQQLEAVQYLINRRVEVRTHSYLSFF